MSNIKRLLERYKRLKMEKNTKDNKIKKTYHVKNIHNKYYALSKCYSDSLKIEQYCIVENFKNIIFVCDNKEITKIIYKALGK